jgi:DNA-binding NtrC family response regulator
VARILLIDDDDRLREYLREELTARGHVVEALDRAEESLDRLAETRFDVVVLDNKMPRITGLEFLAEIRSRGLDTPVILMTASHTFATAIRATALGAFKYVIKPAERELLAALLESEIRAELARAREAARLPNVQFAPRDADESPGEHVLVGNGESMLKVCGLIGRYANSSHPVLIWGETGTGKELVARAIHDVSERKGKEFVPVNCGAITPNLAESQLFGHKKGSFTSADRDHVGFFERADGGTLFLDEIGDMPLDLQVKLLRVLQEGRVERVGGTEPIKVDVRVLAATHCDLPAMVKSGTFREDLYGRLYCFDIRLPPLRERLEDLPDLVHCFLDQEAAKTGRHLEIAEATLGRLREYHWPRNVRQLKNVMAKAFVFCQGSQILPQHIEFPAEDAATPNAGTEDDASAGLRRAIAWAFDTGEARVWELLNDRLERELLLAARERVGANQTAIAERLGISWNTLSKLMKKHGFKD